MQQDGGAVSLKDVPGFKEAAKKGIKYISQHVGCAWKASASDLKNDLNKLLESTILNSYYAPPAQVFTPNTVNNTNLVRDRVRVPTKRSLFKLPLQENDADLNQDDDDADFNPVDDNSQHGEDVQEDGSASQEDGSASQEDGSASQVKFPLTVRQFKEKVLGYKPEFRQEVITAELPSIHADLRKAKLNMCFLFKN